MKDATSKTTFTSDYALYWWDYLAGYDTVLLSSDGTFNQQITPAEVHQWWERIGVQ
jgi:hypothetical protein